MDQKIQEMLKKENISLKKKSEVQFLSTWFLVEKKVLGRTVRSSNLKELNKIRISVPMFRSVNFSKNIYGINENSNFYLEKTLHQDHNIHRRPYAFNGGYTNESFMARDTLIYLVWVWVS